MVAPSPAFSPSSSSLLRSLLWRMVHDDSSMTICNNLLFNTNYQYYLSICHNTITVGVAITSAVPQITYHLNEDLKMEQMSESVTRVSMYYNLTWTHLWICKDLKWSISQVAKNKISLIWELKYSAMRWLENSPGKAIVWTWWRLVENRLKFNDNFLLCFGWDWIKNLFVDEQVQVIITIAITKWAS